MAEERSTVLTRLSLQDAEAARCPQATPTGERVHGEGPGELPPASHYLYIPNGAGTSLAAPPRRLVALSSDLLLRLPQVSTASTSSSPPVSRRPAWRSTPPWRCRTSCCPRRRSLATPCWRTLRAPAPT